MKPNYFTIHKNKKPKRLFKKRPINPFTLKVVLTAVMGAKQIHLINTQWLTPKEEKERQIFESLLGTSTSILKMTKEENRRLFLETGRYRRNKTRNHLHIK
jgi:hypothetical protein